MNTNDADIQRSTTNLYPFALLEPVTNKQERLQREVILTASIIP